jgi:hypothetical protein
MSQWHSLAWLHGRLLHWSLAYTLNNLCYTISGDVQLVDLQSMADAVPAALRWLRTATEGHACQPVVQKPVLY